MTLRQAARWAAVELRDVTEGELNARWLLAEVSGMSRLEALSNPNTMLPEESQALFQQGVQRLKAGEPLAYIIGKRGFWGREFTVRSGVLIPRQDTETIVEIALGLKLPEAPHVLDLCCGSGALAVTLYLELEKAHVVAADISPICLCVAARNAALYRTMVEIVLSDMFSGLAGRRFDLIVCNPPYISSRDISALETNVRDYEPVLALDGGEDGLKYYRELCGAVRGYLKDGGVVLMEVGHNQAGEVSAMFERRGCDCAIHQDLNGIDRVVEARYILLRS